MLLFQPNDARVSPWLMRRIQRAGPLESFDTGFLLSTISSPCMRPFYCVWPFGLFGLVTLAHFAHGLRALPSPYSPTNYCCNAVGV